MKRIQLIIKDKDFIYSQQRVAELEKQRIFCCHGMQHLMDVARIAWILTLEAGASYDKEVVYAAGLLHDIGKYLQYEDGIPHHESGARMAETVLFRAGFKVSEIQSITEAIYHHRTLVCEDKRSLNYILYKADKLSRPCYDCAARDKCNWPKKQMNLDILY